MTVQELMERLAKLPPDLPVRLRRSDRTVSDITVGRDRDQFFVSERIIVTAATDEQHPDWCKCQRICGGDQ